MQAGFSACFQTTDHSSSIDDTKIRFIDKTLVGARIFALIFLKLAIRRGLTVIKNIISGCFRIFISH